MFFFSICNQENRGSRNSPAELANVDCIPIEVNLESSIVEQVIQPPSESSADLSDIGNNACEFQNDLILDFWDTTNNDKCLNDIAVKLFGSPDFTIKHAVDVMKILKEFSKQSSSILSEMIKDCATIEEAQNIIKSEGLFDFSNYLTEFKMKSQLIAENLYSEPQKFLVRNEVVEYAPGYMANVEHQGVIMDIKFQIKKFLELDGVIEGIINYQEELMELPTGIYKNFVNGFTWRSIMNKYQGKVCIPSFLYNDDFQVDDKKGPHSTVNSLSAFYYVFPTMPPHVSSKLDSIFIAMFVKARDIKEYGISSPLHSIVNVFNDLEVNGILLFEGSAKQKRVYVVLSKVFGDNLGLHTVCGFRTTFNIPHYCMTCEMHIDQCKHMTEVPTELLRTVDKYDQYFENGSAHELGLNENSVLNKLESFHVIDNRVNDLMHDCELGTMNFILKFAIQYFLKTYPSTFTLETLNRRIKSFDCGEKEKKNVPGKILESHLSGKGSLHFYASECSFVFKHFPLIIYDLIPTPDPVYQYILDSIDIMNNCFASEFDAESLQSLKESIKRNKEKYKMLFSTHLKPKDHNMLHYDICIEQNGPLKYLTSMRAEGKHQQVRRYTNICKSRTNICYTVAKKYAFSFSNFLKTNQTGFFKSLTYVNEIRKEMSLLIKEFISNNDFDVKTFLAGKIMFTTT